MTESSLRTRVSAALDAELGVAISTFEPLLGGHSGLT